ncbi:MAG: hypothetical protein ABH863_06155 [Candidatus Micrarchaeota archaeon]
MEIRFLPSGLLIVLILSSFILMGCTSSDQGNLRTGPRGNFTGRGLGNFSGDPAGRQFSEERMKQAEDACIGKSPGEACSIQFQNRSMDGSCQLLNSSLQCEFQFQARPSRLPQ